MELVTGAIALMALVVISNIISHYLVSIPTALIEIALGLVLALSLNLRIEVQADWFMLLFVAPLLFNDGKNFPKDELWELRAPIFAYAIWLVLLTTVVGGFFIHWLIPGIPLALAMALVAVLSPTDPVAVHGIAEQINLPPKLLSLISGESLINDASGLIAFKYALAAFMTSTFSLTHAVGDFVYMAIVGGLIGLALISLIHFIRLFLVQQGIQDVVLHATIKLLTPFIIYIIADEIAHASGVIAVVTAGVLSINQPQVYRSTNSEVKLVTTKMWDVLVYLLNGLVFILLGLELPIAMRATLENPEVHNGILLLDILLIWLFFLAIRVVWSYLYMTFTYLRKDKKARPSFKLALMTGLTGVRGAVTMASIMSMPFVLASGEWFVQRSLIITLACGVVLTSLLVATITLPLLTKNALPLPLTGADLAPLEGPNTNTSHEELTELEARQAMVKNALATLKEEHLESSDYLIVSDLIQEFESRLRHLYREHNDEETNRLYAKLEKMVQTVALTGELAGVSNLLADGVISERSARNYRKFIATKKEAFEPGFWSAVKRFFVVFRRQSNFFLWRWQAKSLDEESQHWEAAWMKLELESTRMALNYLKTYKQEINPESEGAELLKHLTGQKLYEYVHKLQRLKHFSHETKVDYQLLVQEYYMKALDAERETVQDLFKHGKINLTLANHLRQSLNYYESSILLKQGNNH